MSGIGAAFHREAFRNYMDRYLARAGMSRGRRERRQEEEVQPKPRQIFRDSGGRELRKPGIQGFAAIFDKTFRYGDELVFFQQGCMHDLYSGGKKMLLDHDENKQVGSTGLGLEFANTCAANPVNGLAFRMPLPEDNPDSALIYDTVTNLERPCVSVGVNIEDSEVVKVKGFDVKVVIRASLNEISLVREGAVPGTHACVVDLADEEPWLLLAARSNNFVNDKYLSNMDASGKRLIDKLAKLKS